MIVMKYRLKYGSDILNPFSILRFNESLSCLTCNDKLDEVTTLNVPALSAYYKVFISLSLSTYYKAL